VMHEQQGYCSLGFSSKLVADKDEGVLYLRRTFLTIPYWTSEMIPLKKVTGFMPEYRKDADHLNGETSFYCFHVVYQGPDGRPAYLRRALQFLDRRSLNDAAREWQHFVGV
jgi:hypothetical protein